MSRSTKLIVGIFVGIAAFVSLCAGTLAFASSGPVWNGIARALQFDSAKVSSQAADIAEFVLPEGYAPRYSFRAAGFNLVGYDPGDGHSHLMLVRAPEWAELDAADFETYLRRNFGDMLGWGEKGDSTLVDRRSLRVAGAPVEFVISEGVNGAGGDYRAMVGVWESPNGKVLIYVEEPLTRWNQAEIDAFIASIH